MRIRGGEKNIIKLLHFVINIKNFLFLSSDTLNWVGIWELWKFKCVWNKFEGWKYWKSILTQIFNIAHAYVQKTVRKWRKRIKQFFQSKFTSRTIYMKSFQLFLSFINEEFVFAFKFCQSTLFDKCNVLNMMLRSKIMRMKFSF